MAPFFERSLFALNLSGRVFESNVELGSCTIIFSAVPELSCQEIVWLSGSYDHCLAVSSESRIFGCGLNECGQLRFKKGRSNIQSFAMISSLSGYEIRTEYDGLYHSLFERCEGKILASGPNYCGQLLFNSGPSIEYVYSPKETTTAGGATLCVAGDRMRVVFIDRDSPPNMLNMRVHHLQY